MVKRIHLTLLLSILIIGSIYSQVNDSLIIGSDIPEIMPTYKGGNHQMRIFIDSVLTYPKTAIRDSIEGKIFINFLVDTNGITYNHRIIRGIRDDLDKEAIRVAKLIKFEKPAMRRGKPMRMNYNLMIEFKLNDKKK